jgi:hypothetical protein
MSVIGQARFGIKAYKPKGKIMDIIVPAGMSYEFYTELLNQEKTVIQ